MVVSSPVRELPEDLVNNIALIELPVPTLDELIEFARREAEAVVAAGGTSDASEPTLQQMARALQGLTLRRGAPRHPSCPLGAERAGRRVRPRAAGREAALVNRTGVIEFIPTVSGIEDIGGLEHHEGLAAGAPQAVPDARRS